MNLSSEMLALLLGVTVLVPLVSTGLVLMGRVGPGALVLAPLPGLLTPWPLLVGSTGETAWGLALPWLLLGAQLTLDPITLWWMPPSAAIWALAAWLGRSELAGRRGLMGLWGLALSGNLWLLLAGDPVSILAATALSSLAAYGLIVVRNDPAAHRAGRVYLVLMILGEVASLVGLILLVVLDGTGSASIVGLISVLLLLGFGVKAGVFPLHFSLPLSYQAAPPWAGLVLAAALINAPLVAWLRLIPALDPAEAAASGSIWLVLGLTAAFYGALMGLGQRRPGALLGYSSMSQIGLLTAALGLGLSQPASAAPIQGMVLFYALHHAVAKAAAFAGLDWWEKARRARRPWILLGLIIPALAIAGAPGTSGLFAKLELKHALGREWGTLLSVSSLLTAALMGRFLWLMAQAVTQPPNNPRRASGPAAPVVFTAFLVASLGLGVAAALNGIGGTERVWDKVLLEAAWPLVAGLALGIGTAALGIYPRLPAGDGIVLLRARPRASGLLPSRGLPVTRGGLPERLVARGAKVLDGLEGALRLPAYGGIAVFLVLLLLFLTLVPAGVSP